MYLISVHPSEFWDKYAESAAPAYKERGLFAGAYASKVNRSEELYDPVVFCTPLPWVPAILY